MGTRAVDSVEPDSVVASDTVRASSSMRSVNTSMRQVSESFALADPIAFFCECAIPSCYSVVWMSASSFDATVEDRTDWLLAETHTPSRPRPVEEQSSGVTLLAAGKDTALNLSAP